MRLTFAALDIFKWAHFFLLAIVSNKRYAESDILLYFYLNEKSNMKEVKNKYEQDCEQFIYWHWQVNSTSNSLILNET